MQSLAASGQTVVLQQKGRRTVVFTKEGAFRGDETGSLLGFGGYLEDPDCW